MSEKTQQTTHREQSGLPTSDHRPSPYDQMLSITQIGQWLNVSPRQLWRLIAVGSFPGPDLSIGKIRRWNAVTVRRWLNEQDHNHNKKGAV